MVSGDKIDKPTFNPSHKGVGVGGDGCLSLSLDVMTIHITPVRIPTSF